MNEAVILSVRANLQRIIEQLDGMQGKAQDVNQAMKGAGKGVEESLGENTRKTEEFLNRLGSLGGRIADQIRRDFKSLISLEALYSAAALTERMKDAVAETLSLNDATRKLAATYGILDRDRGKFEAGLLRGLGSLGLGPDTGAQALKSLASTPVRGQGNVLEYAKYGGMLGSAAGEPQNSGEIAAGMARAIAARGGNANDLTQMRELADDLLAMKNATGAMPSQSVKSLEEMFLRMPEDMRKRMGARGMAGLSAIAMQVPGGTKGFEEVMKRTVIDRMPIDAQANMTGMLSDQGVDLKKFLSASNAVLSRIGFDPRMAASTLGISPEAAEGFVRLNRKLKEEFGSLSEAQRKVIDSSANTYDQYTRSRTIGEKFRGGIYGVMGALANPISTVSQGGFGGTAKGALGWAGPLGVVGGTTALAALLAGYGLRGVGAGLAGGAVRSGLRGAAGGFAGAAGNFAAGQAMEKIGGGIPVWVLNPGGIGIGGASAAAAAAAKALPAAAAAVGTGAVVAAAAVGVATVAAGVVNEKRVRDDVEAPLNREVDRHNENLEVLGEINKSIREMHGELKVTIKGQRFDFDDPGPRAIFPTGKGKSN